MKQAVKQIIEVIKKPFYAIKDAIKTVVKTVKVIVKKIKEILLTIKRIIMAIGETNANLPVYFAFLVNHGMFQLELLKQHSSFWAKYSTYAIKN